MDALKIKKIQDLVRSSPMLNAGERQEWLQLVEIMTEAQVLELEKILTNQFGQKAAPAKPLAATPSAAHLASLVKQQPAHKLQPPATPQQGYEKGKVNLGHIVNLPSASYGVQQKSGPKAPAPSKPAPKPSPVAERVEHALHEKELLPGHGEQPSPVPQEKPHRSWLVKKTSELKQLPLVPQAKKPAPEPPVKPAAVKEKNPAAIAKQLEPLEKPATNTPEAVFKKILQTQVTFHSSKSPALKKKEEAPQAQDGPPKLTFKAPQDLVSLAPDALRTYNAEDLVRKMRELVSNYGYHETLSNLEKSPLYQSYIQTGIKILSEQKDFEKLTREKSLAGTPYLSKNDFEGFVDLLRLIQI